METPVVRDIEQSLKGMVEVKEKKGYEGVDEWEVDELLEWTNGLNFDHYVSTWKEYATSVHLVKLPVNAPFITGR
jgi:hypothetical protein